MAARCSYFLYGLIVFLAKFPCKVEWNISRAIKEAKKSASFATHIILSSLIIHVDTLILSLLSDTSQVGLYQAGMRLIVASMLMAVIISDAFIPEISTLIDQKRKAYKKLSKLFDFVILFAILTVVSIYFYRKTIITFLFSEEYLILEGSLFLIVSIIMLRYVGIVPGIILTSYGKQRIRAIAVVASLIVSVILNIFLIPLLGIKGAFIASLAAHIILNLLYLIYSSRVITFYRSFATKWIATITTFIMNP